MELGEDLFGLFSIVSLSSFNSFFLSLLLYFFIFDALVVVGCTYAVVMLDGLWDEGFDEEGEFLFCRWHFEFLVLFIFTLWSSRFELDLFS